LIALGTLYFKISVTCKAAEEKREKRRDLVDSTESSVGYVRYPIWILYAWPANSSLGILARTMPAVASKIVATNHKIIDRSRS